MKKNVLGWELLLFICGIAFILMGLFVENLTHGSIIFATGCGFIGGNMANIYKYFYWRKPEKKLIYEERLKKEKINLYDERKIMLRQKSGQITYSIMFIVLTVLNIVFTFIGIEKWIILTLWGVIAFQYFCGLIVFHHLSRKM
ncbi:hypothetical protein QBE52_09815 [Clostridiaceae bacterium 35-E11]